MKLVRRGMGTALLVAVVIIIIAVAAIGTYVLVSSKSVAVTTTSTSSSITTQTTSTTAVSSTTSTVSSTSTSTSTSTTTSISTTSVTPSSTSTASTQSTSCTSSTQTTTGSLASEFNFTGMFNDYSSVTVHLIGTENGGYLVAVSTYNVLNATSRGFKVNVTLAGGSSAATTELFAWRNGSVAWVYSDHTNETGAFAQFGYILAMSAFIYQPLFSSPNFISSLLTPGLIKPNGTSVIMIGGTSVNATTYVPTQLPLVMNQCGGTSVDFAKFALQLGQVAGKATVILTRFDIAGSISTGGGSPQYMDLSYVVTSITKS